MGMGRNLGDGGEVTRLRVTTFKQEGGVEKGYNTQL